MEIDYGSGSAARRGQLFGDDLDALLGKIEQLSRAHPGNLYLRPPISPVASHRSTAVAAPIAWRRRHACIDGMAAGRPPGAMHEQLHRRWSDASSCPRPSAHAHGARYGRMPSTHAGLEQLVLSAAGAHHAPRTAPLVCSCTAPKPCRRPSLKNRTRTLTRTCTRTRTRLQAMARRLVARARSARIRTQPPSELGPMGRAAPVALQTRRPSQLHAAPAAVGVRCWSPWRPVRSATRRLRPGRTRGSAGRSHAGPRGRPLDVLALLGARPCAAEARPAPPVAFVHRAPRPWRAAQF